MTALLALAAVNLAGLPVVAILGWRWYVATVRAAALSRAVVVNPLVHHIGVQR